MTFFFPCNSKGNANDALFHEIKENSELWFSNIWYKNLISVFSSHKAIIGVGIWHIGI